MSWPGADEVHHRLHERSLPYLVQATSRCQQSEVRYCTIITNIQSGERRLFGVLYNIAKPFLTDRVKDNIVFHG